jgi:hypothetical protein
MSNKIILEDHPVEVQSASGKINSSVIHMSGFTYKIKDIPDELILIGDVFDEKTEQTIIDLIEARDTVKVTNILNCIAKEFEESLGKKLTDRRFYKLKAGDGMNWEREDRTRMSTVVVINLGSDILMTFQKGLKKTDIMLPRRSMFLLKDPKYEYSRGIAKRAFDFFDKEKVFRKDRYSLVFKAK